MVEHSMRSASPKAVTGEEFAAPVKTESLCGWQRITSIAGLIGEGTATPSEFTYPLTREELRDFIAWLASNPEREGS